MPNTMNTVTVLKIAMPETIHPAIADALEGMLRSPEDVFRAAIDEVNTELESKAYSGEDSGEGRKVKPDFSQKSKSSVTLRIGAKKSTMTVRASMSQTCKVSDSGASRLLALNERFDAIAEMLCAVHECRLPSGITGWVRENIEVDPVREAAAAKANATTAPAPAPANIG